MNLPQALAQLEAVFGRQEQSKLAAYAVVLRGLDEDEVARATEAALRTCKFFPSPAQLLDLARGHKPALAALPSAEKPHEPSASRAIAGRFRERGNALDGVTYCAADLQGYPSRAMIAAWKDDPQYLTLHGERDISLAARQFDTMKGNVIRRNTL